MQGDRLLEKVPQRSFLWEVFSGLQPFVHLQAPILAWPTDCSDRQDSKFLRPPGRIHRAGLASLPITSSGITTCPNRTIDTTGLVMASAITHLWDRSLVGCSYTLHLVTLVFTPFILNTFSCLGFRAVDYTLLRSASRCFSQSYPPFSIDVYAN